jgi:glyoxylase-like metal-dependent hydrolase (beta-lactamase superfamily II)
MIAAAMLSAAIAVVFAQAGSDLEVLPLRSNFYMIGGGGGNIAFQVGDDGVVVVDAGSAAAAPAVVAAIKKVTAAPIRYVIDTSADADHVGGNETVAKAGQTLLQSRAISLPDDFLGTGASILAAEKVLTRMSAPTGQTSPFPSPAGPPRRSITGASTCTSMAKASRCCSSPRRTPTAIQSSSSAVRM